MGADCCTHAFDIFKLKCPIQDNYQKNGFSAYFAMKIWAYRNSGFI